MQGVIDCSLRHSFEEAADGGVKAKSFWAIHKGDLELVAAKDDWDFVFSKPLPSDAPEHVDRLAQTKVGAAMFKGDLEKAWRKIFMVEVANKIRDLEHLDFEASAVVSFRASMKAEAAKVAVKCKKRFERIIVPVKFLGEEVKVDSECVDDIWVFMYNSHLKAAAMNSNKTKMFPWQSLLFENDEVPDAPEWADISDEQFVAINEVRDTILELCGTEPLTLAKMKDLVCGKTKGAEGR